MSEAYEDWNVAEVERLRNEVRNEIKRLRIALRLHEALEVIAGWEHDPDDTYAYDVEQMRQVARDALKHSSMEGTPQ